MTDPEHPLTARVFVNRVWLKLMGRGIVSTPDNFGKMGALPSHPELLNWLAWHFMDTEFSIKDLVRLIVESRAYRAKSAFDSDSSTAKTDPGNHHLWRQNRRRLDSEEIRDAMLAIGGRLDLRMGGRSMREGTKSEFGYQFSDSRRSVYLPIFRNRLPEAFQAFDFANPNIVTGQRTATTLPAQALFIMNGELARIQARAAAKKLSLKAGDDVTPVYLSVFGRPPSQAEADLATRFLAGASNSSNSSNNAVDFIQALFASAEFQSRN